MSDDTEVVLEGKSQYHVINFHNSYLGWGRAHPFFMFAALERLDCLLTDNLEGISFL